MTAVLVLGGCGAAQPDRAADPPLTTDGASAPTASTTTLVCVPPGCGELRPYLFGDGYVGPTYRDDTPAGVDADSVVTAADGSWWAQGLVVAGGEGLFGAPVVTAELRDLAGGLITTASAPALVSPVRAGEPVPFRLDAAVDARDVASVQWSAAPGAAAGDPSGRELQLDVFWTRPAGGRPVSVVGYADQGGPGTPLVAYLAVTNPGNAAVPGPAVVAAWIDGRGAVVGVASSPVLAPGTDAPASVLEPGAQADAVVVLAGGDGLDALVPVLWSVAAP